MLIETAVLAVGNYVVLLGAFALLWALSVRIKDASIVDIAWGPACALPGVLTYLRADGPEPRSGLLVALACLWAGRLAFHLGRRNLGHGEDYRYQAMRAKQGSDAEFARWSLIWVFGLQATIAWLVSAPLQFGQTGRDGALGLLAWTGVVIFFVGLFFETVGDAQLTAFKKDPANKGRLMTRGLWAYTRHPNYFGDACVWTGLALIATEAPYGWIALFSPALMAFFLVRVSGKALLERKLRKTYPDYADYERRVSGFIPLPPKR
jgi:steroid 5-alpha reductase family enzyme